MKRNNVFNEFVSHIEFIYDMETNQYSLINDKTPGLYGLGDTKEEAVKEYLSGFSDLILVNNQKENEVTTFA